MQKKVKLLPPMMPNFLPMEESGEISNHRISVSQLSKEEAIEYGELMKQTFIKHWEKKSLIRTNPFHE